MTQIEEFDRNDLHFFRLKDESDYVDICPERGGIVTAFHADNEDLLFMNEDTLFDTSKNVRGGIPVLFPIAGQLTDKQYQWNEKSYSMANHGLVRTRPLQVVGNETNERFAELTLSFSSSAETRAAYPFDFEMLLMYRLADGKLSIQQKIFNHSAEAMPVYPGYHPYFAIQNKTLTVATKATEYLDYNDQQIKPLNGAIQMDGLKESVVLADGAVTTSFNADKNLVVEADDAFRYTVLWVEGDQPFVCVEPWTAKTNTFNEAPDNVLLVQPEQPKTLTVSFHLENR
ncbi:aldose epimerase [Sporolactobacillus spathodeae]|uniref:Galactose mutarotase-like enzyme n=1 Tax=Sporolactobacillus spathodeae TaxID=1465502 RepID=A0ABS2Q652_9BACL|nr:aldose epimerase [Sporolactobacillus spathodeae]MBM7657248.1 galactose mutarotase-like enzyme [Sporolactobacillus spathodeae]